MSRTKTEEVWGAIDEAFGRAHERYPEAVKCRSGCADCCGVVAFLTIVPYEAEIVRRHLASLTDEERAHIATLASREERDRCILLGDDARCSIYLGRPMVCRAFGLPYRNPPQIEWEDGKRRLRVLEHGVTLSEERVASTCYKNVFPVFDENLEADVVIDQQSLNELARRCHEEVVGTPHTSERVLLSKVVREALGLPVPDPSAQPET